MVSITRRAKGLLVLGGCQGACPLIGAGVGRGGSRARRRLRSSGAQRISRSLGLSPLSFFFELRSETTWPDWSGPPSASSLSATSFSSIPPTRQCHFFFSSGSRPPCAQSRTGGSCARTRTQSSEASRAVPVAAPAGFERPRRLLRRPCPLRGRRDSRRSLALLPASSLRPRRLGTSRSATSFCPPIHPAPLRNFFKFRPAGASGQPVSSSLARRQADTSASFMDAFRAPSFSPFDARPRRPPRGPVFPAASWLLQAWPGGFSPRRPSRPLWRALSTSLFRSLRCEAEASAAGPSRPAASGLI